MEIVASGRMKVLDKFYVGKVSNAALIEEELKSNSVLSDDVKGQWVTEQFFKAATTLHVEVFVKPLEQGGMAIPEIPPLEHYEVKHSELKAVVMRNILDSLPMRQRAEDRARRLVAEADEWVEDLRVKLEELTGTEDSTTEDPAETAKMAKLLDELDKANEAYEVRYAKWSNEQACLQKDLQTVEEWRQKAKSAAMAQRDADCDALRQVVNALALLKKFVAGLMVKVPTVGIVIRQMGEFGGDPYEGSDMRRCYANLLAKYRKTEDLDVAMSVIIALKESQQANETVGQFTRRIQEFHEEMVRMGIRTISVSDLSAMIMISGMHQSSRESFLKTETTLALAMSDAEATDDFLSEAGDEERTTGGTKMKRSLLGKTLRFVGQQETEQHLNAMLNTNGAVKNAAPTSTVSTSKEALRRVREAQQAFAVAVRSEDRGACYEYARSGKCNRPNCTFKHQQTMAAPDGGTPKRLQEKGECNNWYHKGTCAFKNTCRFRHPPRDSVPKVPESGGKSGAEHANPAQNKAAAQTTQPAKKNASSVLFASDQGMDDFSVYDEEVSVVIARAVPALACATSDVRPRRATNVHYIGYDSMCSLHVASSLALIPGASPLKEPREAVGMGGVRPITHKGYSTVFGKEMSYIKDGGTPNLLSVGQECQRDATGLSGMVLFSATGAVRFRVTPELMAGFAALVDQAEVEGLVQGKAVQRNNVYKEAFGPAGTVEYEEVVPVEDQDAAFAVSHSMFASRIKLDSVDNVLDFMVQAGLSKQALLEGIKTQSLRGLPAVVTEDHVKQYFKAVGKSPEQLEAEITKAPLAQPVDYEAEKALAPGSIMQIDNVDPSFSRMAGGTAEPSDVGKNLKGVEGLHKRVVPSVGGYKDAVLAIDEATGYAHIIGRVIKKDPHKILAQFMGKWRGRWGNLTFIKGDKEFLTHESVALVNAYDVRYRQAVPGDHRRTVNMIEGSIRWILEIAQANMNLLRRHVKEAIITEHQARTLWFHALRQAVFVFNFRPSLWDPGKTRYEMGTGDIANLTNVVLMPFGMRLMGKNLLTSADGRGSECLYIGPSSTVRGGVLTYSLATERVSVKYAFLPINDVRRPGESQLRKVTKEVYGKMKEMPIEEPQPTSKADLPGWEDVRGFDAVPTDTPESVPPALAAVPTVPEDVPCTTTDIPSIPVAVPSVPESVPVVLPENVLPEVIPPTSVVDQNDLAANGVSAQSRGGVKTKNVVVSEYNTRRRRERVMAILGFSVEVSDEEVAEEVPGRPPRPKPPPSRVCDADPRWKAAEEREAAKLMEEDTFIQLPVDQNGRPVRPADAIVLRLIKIREFKWKPDPDTGVEGWLECVRLVCDGSVDKRPEKYYAETPDRTLLLLMTSIEASLGIKATGSDVTRAYLNAESLDRNIVIVAPGGIKGLPRESLLNKGLYGSRGGALSWQVWIDSKLTELGYEKLQVCRGVYMKKEADGIPVRAYRHSDDFRMSCASDELRASAENNLKALVRMADFTTLVRFLGCTFERVNAVTGLPDPNGTIVLVRQVEKIREMEERFVDLHKKYNASNRVRSNALPIDAIKKDSDLTEKARVLLDAAGIEQYQQVVGCIQWVVGCTRPDAKLGSFLLSTRLAKPRVWDMFLAVYVMDYLVGTVDAPLVLGGDEMDPIIFADASFATLPEGRSIMGHVAFSGKGSGAIYAQVGSTKTAVTSVWEAELMAGCSGMDTGLYLTGACKEMEFEVPSCRRVMVDNKAEIDWVKGSVSNKRSRHIDVRYYRSRHLQESRAVSVEYVPTQENVADMLTKPLAAKLFVKFARIILGHGLLLGRNVKGIFEMSLDEQD